MWPICRRVIFLISGFVLQSNFTEKREKSWAIQEQGQNKWSVSKWRQCDIKTLVTELVDFNETSNFLSSEKWKTKAAAFICKPDVLQLR